MNKVLLYSVIIFITSACTEVNAKYADLNKLDRLSNLLNDGLNGDDFSEDKLDDEPTKYFTIGFDNHLSDHFNHHFQNIPHLFFKPNPHLYPKTQIRAPPL